MWISELFCSVQGEGRHVGVPSTFIRTSGCNLRCSFCDTPETSWFPEGTVESLESLLQAVADFGTEHVVITGGEPLLSPELVPLTEQLHARGHVITIETAGTVSQNVRADLLSISPKLSNSTPVGTDWESRHEQRRDRPEILQDLTTRYDYQLKFVVATKDDVDEVAGYVARFPHLEPQKIYLMPEGVDAAVLKSRMVWLESAAAEHGWQVSPRLHIELFGNTRGT